MNEWPGIFPAAESVEKMIAKNGELSQYKVSRAHMVIEPLPFDIHSVSKKYSRIHE
jgi:hypothetical protein